MKGDPSAAMTLPPESALDHSVIEHNEETLEYPLQETQEECYDKEDSTIKAEDTVQSVTGGDGMDEALLEEQVFDDEYVEPAERDDVSDSQFELTSGPHDSTASVGEYKNSEMQCNENSHVIR